MDSRVCEALSYVDKGLYAETLGEKMELLVNLKTLMSNTRIPYFINAAVLRLLEAFRIDDSALRRFIIQILNECTDELAVVYSKTEITRRLLRFSYSNDSLKRAYNLRLLATLAAVISDSKRVHHLIMKSVDCESRDERAAAVVAMNAFAAASKRFSEMTLRKIEEVINSPQCSLRLKVYVVRVIANLHNDDETIVNAIDICEKILFKTPNKYIAFNIIQSVTSIVQKRRITMPRLMDVLLRYHKASADGRSLRMVILESIKRLSPAADLFSNAVIQELCEMNDSIEKPKERLLWLSVIRSLISQQIRSVNTLIIGAMLQRSNLLFDANDDVSLMAVEVFVCLYSFMPSPTISSLLQNTFLKSVHKTPHSNTEKFYRLLTAFVRVKSCPTEVVNSLTDACILNPHTSSTSLSYLLQFFIIAAETHPQSSTRLCNWAVDKLKESVDFPNKTLFARLIYAPGVNIDEISLDRSSIWGKNAWTNYLVARTAMRNGHLRSIALPILESIEFSAANTENRLWLSALKSICKAAIGEFKVSELENAISNYDHAVCTLEMLCVKKTWWHCFWFCERYVNCLRSTLAVLRRVLVTRNFTSLPLSVGAPSKQWKTCATNMVECYDKWHCLLRECYDADADTITSLDLKCFECSLMCAALMWLVEEDSQLCFDSCLELFASVCTSAVNNYHRELLEWAKGELDRLKNANIPLEKRLSNQYISPLINVLAKLCCAPVYIPRFFFQQLKRTEFKLTVSPQSSDDTQSTDDNERQPSSEANDEFITAQRSDSSDESCCLRVARDCEIPFVVEATFSSRTSCHIETFIINITVTCKEKSRMLRSWSETIKSEEENHFKTTIPFLPQQDCTINFTVDFVDKTRRRWRCHSHAEVKILLRDDEC